MITAEVYNVRDFGNPNNGNGTTTEAYKGRVFVIIAVGYTGRAFVITAKVYNGRAFVITTVMYDGRMMQQPSRLCDNI